VKAKGGSIEVDGRGGGAGGKSEKEVLIFQGSEWFLEKLEAFDEGEEQRRVWEPFVEGTRWKCLKCGRCCRESWRVNLTWEEHDRLSSALDIQHVVVDERTGMSHPVMLISGRCKALDDRRNVCTIYRRRMYSCATFPFSLGPDGELFVAKYCRGFGQGPVVMEEDIVKYIMKWRKKAGMVGKHLKRGNEK
jgi:Fe-S-cluster containining protein